MDYEDTTVVKKFAEYAGVPETIAQQELQALPLSDYAAFVSALDANNDDEIMRIVNISKQVSESFDYFPEDVMESLGSLDFTESTIKRMLENSSMVSLSESTLLSKYSVFEQMDYLSLLPSSLKESYEFVNNLLESQLDSYLGIWMVNEDASISGKRDVAAMKYFYENTINTNLKNNIAKIAQTSSSNIKKPGFVDPKTKKAGEIISADPQSKTVATVDDKGEVDIHKIDPQNKNQITFEDVDIMKALAGIK